MAIEIREVSSPAKKKRICGDILRALPEWFAYEEPIADYAAQAKHMPFYAAFDGSRAVGFIAIKAHNAHTAEVCVMGVLRGCHRRGIGRGLVECAVRYCLANKMEFLTVKTVDESTRSAGYANTRKFYCAMGFVPLEVFPLYWDKNNPCLFMAKHIGL